MKKYLILVSVLIILVGWFYWLNYIENKKINTADEIWFPFNFSDLSLNTVKFNNQNWGYEFSKNWTWYLIQDLESNKSYPVITDESDKLINALRSSKFSKLVSKSKDTWDSYWIETWTSWTILSIDWKYKIYFWNLERYSSQYLAVDWYDDVYQVDKILGMLLDRQVSSFRDRNIYSANWVTKIEVFRDWTSVFEKSATGWILDWKSVSVDQLLSLQANDIIEKSNKDLSKSKDGNIKYYSWSDLLNQIDFKFEDNNGFIEKGDELYKVDIHVE